MKHYNFLVPKPPVSSIQNIFLKKIKRDETFTILCVLACHARTPTLEFHFTICKTNNLQLVKPFSSGSIKTKQQQHYGESCFKFHVWVDKLKRGIIVQKYIEPADEIFSGKNEIDKMS